MLLRPGKSLYLVGWTNVGARPTDSTNESMLLQLLGYGLARYTRKCLFCEFCCISHLGCGEHTGSTADVMGAKLSRTAYFRPLIIEIARYVGKIRGTVV